MKLFTNTHNITIRNFLCTRELYHPEFLCRPIILLSLILHKQFILFIPGEKGKAVNPLTDLDPHKPYIL